MCKFYTLSVSFQQVFKTECNKGQTDVFCSNTADCSHSGWIHLFRSELHSRYTQTCPSRSQFLKLIFEKIQKFFDDNDYLSQFLTMFIQEHFSVLRRLTYPDADVFIICFSIIDPYSFKRVQTKWVKELSEYCPNTPVVLVGTKYDQRNNINTKILLNKHGLQPVSSEQGEQVARKIGAKQVNFQFLHPEFTSISTRILTPISPPWKPPFHPHLISPSKFTSCTELERFMVK